MAEFNGKQGHWVTTNGRHIFISDDPAEKQEKEIADSKERSEAYNKSRQQESDPIANNPFYLGIAQDVKKVLAMPEGDFEQMSDKYNEIYGLQETFAKYGIKSGETYDSVVRAEHKLRGFIHDGFVNTGKYDEEVKKYGEKKYGEAKAKTELKDKVEKLKKEHPNDYVSRYGVVLESPKGKTKFDVGAYKKEFDKAGEAYFVDGQAESADNPAGIIAKYTKWDDAKPVGTGSFEWGWFTDKDGKRKIWFYEAD